MTTPNQELRQLLQTQRRQTFATRSHLLQDLHENGEGESQTVADEIDRADADLADDVAAALAQMAAETLRLIDDAEARLDTGEYGVCVECGQPIPVARLRALPFAVRCRPCTEMVEAPPRRLRTHASHPQEIAP
jgi:DnaK suppressor protein